MIVVDTNVIAYLLLPGEKTEQAREVLLRDPEWAVPVLWRSEFRSVLVLYMRRMGLTLPHALSLAAEAESLVEGSEFIVESEEVLRLCSGSQCSAYDCEFAALADRLNVPLVTSDSQRLRRFPAAVSMEQFLDA